MARPLLPLPMTYAEWIAQGYPPLQLTVKHVAEWTGLSSVQVNNYCRNETLVRANGSIDTSHPVNMSWLIERRGVAPRCEGRPVSKPHAVAPQAARLAKAQVQQGAALAGVVPTGAEELDLTQILEAIEQMDLTKLPKNQIDKIAKLESAFKTRVDRDAKRGQLIDRTLVATVFAKLYMIDTNQILTLGAKVAPDCAAEFGIEDPEVQLRIEQRISDEALRILGNIKRLMDDFLVGVGGEPMVIEA